MDPHHDDPMVDGGAPERRKGGGLKIVLIVLGGLALLCVAGAAAMLAVLVPRVQERDGRLTCQRNLAELGQHWTVFHAEHEGDVKACQDFLQSLGTPSRDFAAGRLTCPDDPEAATCSYAVRDLIRFPLTPGEREILACDRQGGDGRTPHHADGLVVLYTSGSAAFVKAAELGFAPGEPIVVGPDSPNEMLRKVSPVR